MPEVALPLSAVLAEAADALRAAGMPDARRQGLRIWSDLNDVPVEQPILAQQQPVDPERASRFLQAIHRRAAGEPLPYVTGKAGFRHLTLRIDQRALIPRPETEGLVELLLDRVSTGVVADVGTGSGCIALSLAPDAEFRTVLAIDRSLEALQLARRNHQLLDRPAGVRFVRADLVTALVPESLDALVSNPPYLTLSEYASLDPSVREWEPAGALTAGSDGLEAITRLLHEGWTVVRPAGWLALEVDSNRSAAAAQLASGCGWRDLSVHQDLFGRERYLLARRSDTR